MTSFASNVSHISMMEMVRLSQECKQVLEDINNMDVKIQEILLAYNNHSIFIADGIQLSEYFNLVD